MVANTMDGATQRLYVDGREVASMPFADSVTLGATTPMIGAELENWIDKGYFDGRIDETSIYDSALSAGDVAAAYSALAPATLPGQSLIAHYDFDQDSGSVLLDRSGHGHDGVITGAQWTDGVMGKALHFDGLKDQVLIPFAPDLNTPEFTLVAWIRTDEKTHDQAVIDRVTPGGDAWNYRLMIPIRIHQIEGHDVPSGVVQSDVRDSFTSRWDYIALGQTKVTLGNWRQVARDLQEPRLQHLRGRRSGWHQDRNHRCGDIDDPALAVRRLRLYASRLPLPWRHG